MGYILTEKGEQELDTYAGADEDDLRLTARTLLIPVLEEIRSNPNVTFGGLAASLQSEGFETGTLKGLVAMAVKLGFMERATPPPEASDEEWSEYRKYLSGLGKTHRVSREDRRKYWEKFKGRYPEVSSKALSEEDISRFEQWRGDNPEAHLETIRKWKREHPEAQRVYQKKYREAHKEEEAQRMRDWYDRKKAQGYVWKQVEGHSRLVLPEEDL